MRTSLFSMDLVCIYIFAITFEMLRHRKYLFRIKIEDKKNYLPNKIVERNPNRCLLLLTAFIVFVCPEVPLSQVNRVISSVNSDYGQIV